jgi:hypothetical protein
MENCGSRVDRSSGILTVAMSMLIGVASLSSLSTLLPMWHYRLPLTLLSSNQNKIL